LRILFNYLKIISFTFISNPPSRQVLDYASFSISFFPFKKIQEANIDALAEVVGKDKAEKVFLAVRPETDQNEEGGSPT
jgi:hypothetical protein